jgi:hypothetical protein
MPAKSSKQQMAAGAALAAKRGERPKKALKGASKSMVESMSEKQLEELASTGSRKKLPKRAGGGAKTSGKKSSAGKKSGGTKSSSSKSSGKKSSGKKSGGKR